MSFSFNAAFFIGAVLMLIAFAIQHRGILGTANVQKYIGLAVIMPMLVVGVVPILTGQIDWSNFAPCRTARGGREARKWDIGTSRAGRSFSAPCSSPRGPPTALKRRSATRANSAIRARDTFKAIFYSGLLCLALFILVPFTFQGVLGLQGMLDAGDRATARAWPQAMANMVGRRQRFIKPARDADDPGARCLRS